VAIATGLPAVALAVVLLWTGDFTPKTRWTLGMFAVGTWIIGGFAVRDRVIRPLQTLSNLLAALGEEDYSSRAREAKPDDPLGLAYWEVNVLTETLRARRLQSIEAAALLGRVIAEIDAAIFAFDGSNRLRLVNRAGAHDLLVINDLSAVLREEERLAWRRLVRVLSHEINNSLAPIKSIADSLHSALGRDAKNGTEEDFRTGLSVIASRSEALRRFMGSYARLARLPAPTKQPVDLGELVHRVASLQTRRPVMVSPGPEVTLEADPDQLEQLLINLVSNAADAAEETNGGVTATWSVERQHVDITVDDEGPGLPDPTNLFVPFFTTKPKGSGIGLVLCRQIADAHGGALQVVDRSDRTGCTARLRLPL
jgi:nitrogen fixation/metabolism regulation signal transduction histidine kinase